jgi:hypothetical protein
MNKSIKNLAPSLLLSTEVIAAAERLDELISRAIKNDAFVTSELAAMNACLVSLKAAIQAKRTSLFTADLATKDDARVTSFRGIVGMLHGISGVISKPDNKRTADSLLDIINRHGKRVDNLGYTRKTGAFTSILANFGQQDSQAYITQLGLAYMVTEFTNAQNYFETVYRSKVKAYAQQPVAVAKTQTNAVCYHILKLTEYVDAQAQKDAAVAALVPQLNEAISDIMSKAHGRKTRSQDTNVAPVPVPTPAPVAVTPSSKVVPMSQQPKAQAKAA